VIKSIHIINFAHIENLQVEWSAGLNIITGETGAGKSVILDAIEFATGGRVTTNVAKDQSKPATVIIEFTDLAPYIAELLVEEGFVPGDSLIFRRSVADKKSKIFLNDTLITANLAKRFADLIIEISSQHQSLSMLANHNQLAFLDTFAQIALTELAATFNEYRQTSLALANLREKNLKLETELEYLNHAIEEIKSLSYQEGEEDRLIELRKQLKDFEKLHGLINLVQSSIEEVQLPAINHLEKEMIKFDPESFAQEINLLNKANVLFDEILATMQNKIPNSGSQSLEQVEDRLHKIRGIARKFHLNAQDLPAHLCQLEAARIALANIDQEIEKLERARQLYLTKCLAMASHISQERQTMAVKLAEFINSELASLALPHAKFFVKIDSDEENLNASGFDKIEFMIKTNLEANFAPLKNIASGGEVSRIFLALKAIEAQSSQNLSTIVFDEVDSGFSGKVAHNVGQKLLSLSQKFQIIVITHQPQVASFGNCHIKIEKTFTANQTIVSAKQLTPTERIHEIARMLSGDSVNDNTINAAKVLIERAV
jgi:DNA repair protein RecN (Recombination protein N)